MTFSQVCTEMKKKIIVAFFFTNGSLFLLKFFSVFIMFCFYFCHFFNIIHLLVLITFLSSKHNQVYYSWKDQYSELGIRRSELRFLKGIRTFSLPTLVSRRFSPKIGTKTEISVPYQQIILSMYWAELLYHMFITNNQGRVLRGWFFEKEILLKQRL